MNRHAFTIIEIIMGIVIIAILATIVIPKFIDIRNDAIERSEEYTIGAVREAIQQSYARSLIRDAIPVYPPYLDNEITAQLGAASSQNPLFNAVLTGVITQWELLAMAPEESWYRGPTGTEYQYNPLTGTITAGAFAGGGGEGGGEPEEPAVTWAYPTVTTTVIPSEQINFGGESIDMLQKDETIMLNQDFFTAENISMNMGNPDTVGEPGLYGRSGSDVPDSILQTSDGGYLVVGEGNYVVKMDADGNLMWSQTYIGQGTTRALTVVETHDGGYIIGGYDYVAGSTQSYLIRVDADGNLNNGWSKTYGSGQFTDIKMVYDDGGNPEGYMATGSSGGNAAIVKLGLDGNVMWSKSYGEAMMSSTSGAAIQETLDGGYVITGNSYHTEEPGNPDALVMKVDSNGGLLWKYRYGGDNHDYGRDITVASDGNFIITGDTYSFGGDQSTYLTKIDSDTGGVLWSRLYGDDETDYGISVDTTSDGRIVVIGGTNSDLAAYWSHSAYLLNLNENGEMDSNSELSIIGKQHGSIHIAPTSAQETSDGGYVMAARYGSTPDYCVIKTDAQGNVN